MYIRPNYETKRLFVRNQIKSMKGENLIDYIIVQPPNELIGFNIYLRFEDENNSLILEVLLKSNYQEGELQYFIPSEITKFNKVKYKLKAGLWESEFGYIYFKESLTQGGEL